MLYTICMPIDVVTLKAVTEELNDILSGGRVEKIYQPETDEVTMIIKSGGKAQQLVVSANPSHPRIQLQRARFLHASTQASFRRKNSFYGDFQ